jgi:hypothetical protein
MRIIMIALLVLAPQAMAASLVTDGNGKVTGVNELTLNNVNYDVTFTVGSVTAVYGANAFSYEGSSTGASNAVNKIRDFLNEKNVGKVTGTEAIYIHVPYDLAGGCGQGSTDTRRAQIGYRDDTSEWFRYGDFCGAPASDNGYVMTRFAVSANQPPPPPPPPVPTPAMPALGLLLLAFGVISLGSLRSRKSRG